MVQIDMAMPTNCSKCQFCEVDINLKYEYCYLTLQTIKDNNIKHPKCPLKECKNEQTEFYSKLLEEIRKEISIKLGMPENLLFGAHFEKDKR